MPIPAAITAMGAAAHNNGAFPINVTNPNNPVGGSRPVINCTFHVYLELSMQAKHDALIGGHCRSLGIAPRTSAGTQIPPGAGATVAVRLATFYPARAQTAATAVAQNMTARWQAPQAANTQVFQTNQRVDAAVQSVVQPDGYRYEISYWYESPDVYVLYHCYQ